MTDERKSRKVTEEEYKMLLAYKELKKGRESGQLEFDKKYTLKTNELRIQGMKREIGFKQLQVDREKVLERHADYADDLKPVHVLKTEIEGLKLQIEQLEELNKKAEEESSAY